MQFGAPVTLASPILFAIAMGLLLTTVAIGAWRGVKIARSALALVLMGMLCLSFAAGQPILRRRDPRSVAVMVDLSPSTRGASFRDVAALSRRIRELLGATPFQCFGFAGDAQPISLDRPIAEIPADRTVFSPPPSDAILLFSDARFETSSVLPPTFVVIDPLLESVSDSSVVQAETKDKKLSATISNTSGARVASLIGTLAPTTQLIASGQIVVCRPLQSGANIAGVELNSGDLWPENDSLLLRVMPPYASQRWWVGTSAPSLPGWRLLAPDQLPDDPSQYLSPAIIVLNNLEAEQIGRAPMDRLKQYVGDMGGSLLILGGDRAFAAGKYLGSPLEAISPLSSAPPGAVRRWLLLEDASGSMADDSGGKSRFALATAAMLQLLTALPPHDMVAVGAFSDQLQWWADGKSVRETLRVPLPPEDAMPHGPTNLELALLQIAANGDGQLPIELVVLSDCDMQINKAKEIINAFRTKRIRLDVVALAPGSGMIVIQQMVKATGGVLVEPTDSKNWRASAQKLASAAIPDRLVRSPVIVDFVGDAKGIGGDIAGVSNRTWLKEGAQLWGIAQQPPDRPPMAAVWQVGRGRVAATAYEPQSTNASALADLMARKPRDPRFTLKWRMDRRLGVIVDAVEREKYLNDLKFSLQITPIDSAGGNALSADIPQTGPGRYEISVDAPRHPAIATVLGPEEEIIDRLAVAGRYPPEFDVLGNDHEMMRHLAQQSGGALIWPSDHHAIQIPWPKREEPITSCFAGGGAMLLILGLLRWWRAA
ncbi:MAG: VWA domain-containing protein [Planctomycetota bacterium]|nr:VWA domain-containing protein [Planctomycetota bacterium]